MVGARTFPGNPYDGHLLKQPLEQTAILLEDTGKIPQHVFVDLGFRGVDDGTPLVQSIPRGKYKSLTEPQRRWLKRRSAVEPAIGHLKSDHRMDRCWLKGALGDALHTVLCAVGYNLSWLLRAVVRFGTEGGFFTFVLARGNHVLGPLSASPCPKNENLYPVKRAGLNFAGPTTCSLQQ
jgi:IS5 family transposase